MSLRGRQESHAEPIASTYSCLAGEIPTTLPGECPAGARRRTLDPVLQLMWY